MNESYMVNRDTIKSFGGSWGSGLATLTFESGRVVHSDSGALGRALGSMFDAIAPGHTIDNGKISGQDVIWVLDDMGLTLGGLTTYEDYLDRGNPEIESGESIEISSED